MSRYMPHCIEYTVVLVPGKRYALLQLPDLLTAAEAARLVRFVESLAVPEEVEAK